MIYEPRHVLAEALRTVPGFNGNVHEYPPDVLSPVVAYVERVVIDRERPGLRTLSLGAEIVIVADGSSTEARRTLDESGAAAWMALNRVSTPQSMSTEIVGDGPTYPAIRLIVTTSTAC